MIGRGPAGMQKASENSHSAPTCEIVARAGSTSLGSRIRADASSRIARSFADRARALEAANTGLEHIRIAECLAVRERPVHWERIRYRRARLEMTDLLLHEHAAFERCPGN